MRILKLIPILIIILSGVFSTPVRAHQDTMLELKDGRIIGLPEEFQPAFFSKKDLVLQIKEKKLTFPPCVASFFEDIGDQKMLITASWYHSLDLLPPYIVFHIEGKDRDYRYEFVVLMESLKPFKFWLLTKKGNTQNLKEPKLDKYCRKAIEGSIFELQQ